MYFLLFFAHQNYQGLYRLERDDVSDAHGPADIIIFIIYKWYFKLCFADLKYQELYRLDSNDDDDDDKQIDDKNYYLNNSANRQMIYQ